MTDRIDLTGIKLWARHGALPEEKAKDQLFVVDVGVYFDTSRAAAIRRSRRHHRLRSARQDLHDLVASESHNLIETVADRVATRVLEDAGLERVIVTIHKPQAPMSVEFGDVSVTVDRSR